MKQFLLAMVCICSTSLFAQTKFSPVDKSAMDMAYYPDMYPVLKIQDKATEPLVARAIYSRPQKNGRVIFGELVEYGKVWRLGANEATEIEFYKNVTIKNTKVKKGRYTLYCIPYEDKWTLIINKDTDSWGAFKYNQAKDVVRIDVPVKKQSDIVEAFSMTFEKTPTGSNLQIAWDDVRATMPISF
ncbi:DUF2911 domain-containing protein [Ferruginibacter sp. SUN002]|uniref:DUF2911 domain-containing protein n=1 Tax=Ferruginibacter sp. SUN002 TaxID=2937789 RepID=UPI003D36943A